MHTATARHQIDVRAIAPRERHPLIFSAFRALGARQSMDIVNDHDPKPLYFQMQAEQPGQFAWDYLENGPDVWRVRITRLGQSHGDGRCCGGCGGA